MNLQDFDFSPVKDLLTEGQLHDPELSIRLLGAAEYAAAIRSLQPELPLPIRVKHEHWRFGSHYYMCGIGSGQGCPPENHEELQLWHITVFSGYVHKLTDLGYDTPSKLASDFGPAYNSLADYMLCFENTEVVVKSGALRLHARTWLKRFQILQLDVGNLEDLTDRKIAQL